ncbi:MAG: MBL fold metallo-hydrolase [Opitutus sp.]|nr:MBL fold metallo-hydrolase [Opitutus sp.]
MTPPRSDHFNGKTFFQPHHQHSGGFREFLRWKFAARPKLWPTRVPLTPQPPPPEPRDEEVVVTWIGHASFLLQSARGNVLIDPVFSERVSPFSWIGPRRVHPPGLAFDALPHIDTVLLSHDHYDHCDLPSLISLSTAFNPRFIAPLRNGDLLQAAGARNAVELDWWQTKGLGKGAEVTLTPSKHWSNRFGTPRNHRLWGGFFLKLGPKRIWFVGDSGYDAKIVQDIRQHCGEPDLALVPIGAYEPRWFMASMHMNPAEAVQLHREVGAKQSLGMHWGTFQLTDEGREEPVEALAHACRAGGLTTAEFRVVAPGESIVV